MRKVNILPCSLIRVEAILDTNFIIGCVKEQIPFLEQLREKGFTPMVPKEVLEEMKDLRFKVPHDQRVVIDLGFVLLEQHKVKKVTLGGRTVDEGLIVKGKQGTYIATLDGKIRKMIPKRIGLSTARKSVMVEEA